MKRRNLSSCPLLLPWRSAAATAILLAAHLNAVESFSPSSFTASRAFVNGENGGGGGSTTRQFPVSSSIPFGIDNTNEALVRLNKIRLYENPNGDTEISPPESEVEEANNESAVVGFDPKNNSDVRITSTSDLPSLPASAKIDVYYAEQAIKALGTIGEIVEAYHTGLVFQVHQTEEESPLGENVPHEFTIEWYALNFPFGAFLPDIVEEGIAEDDPASKIKWVNEAYCHYSPVYNPDRWSKGRDLVGSIDGTIFASFAKWVANYSSLHPGYDAFEVWDRPELEAGRTRRWKYSSTCSTFVEEALRELYDLGGFRSSVTTNQKTLLKRSYVPLISRLKPMTLDMSNVDDAQEVVDFYKELNNAVRKKKEEEGLSTSNFVRLLADRLDTFYVYNTRTKEYSRVYLDAPYCALSKLYQPMSLQWQRIDLDGDGVFEDPGAFKEDKNDFVGELSAAAGSIAELLRKRLPPVLKKRFGPQVLKVGLGVVIVGTVIVSDESFLSGVLVGVVLGFGGSKFV